MELYVNTQLHQIHRNSQMQFWVHVSDGNSEQVDLLVCGWYVVSKGGWYVVGIWSVSGR